MPAPFYVDDFAEKIDSLYRLVIVAARRSNQISKNESHGFGGVTHAKKPTIKALEEMLEGRISYRRGDEDEDADLLD